MYGNRSPTFTSVFKTVKDSLHISLDVYLPARINGERLLDVYFYTHGGGMTAMDRTDLPRWLPLEADKRDKILISVDYRLAPQAKVDESFSDVLAGLTWCFNGGLLSALRTQGFGSVHLSRRCAAFGGSAGGWLTLLLGTQQPPELKSLCLGAIYPMTNLSDPHYHERWEIPKRIEREEVQGYLDGPTVTGATPDFNYETGETTGRHRAALYMAQEALWRESILPRQDHETMSRWDVRKHVGSTFPPTYLLHGTNDSTILPSNSVDMADALSISDVPHILRLVQDQAHFFDMLVQSSSEISHMLDWIEAHLQS